MFLNIFFETFSKFQMFFTWTRRKKSAKPNFSVLCFDDLFFCLFFSHDESERAYLSHLEKKDPSRSPHVSIVSASELCNKTFSNIRQWINPLLKGHALKCMLQTQANVLNIQFAFFRRKWQNRGPGTNEVSLGQKTFCTRHVVLV